MLGWLILAVALAVPAFMFWNWWQLLNNKPAEFGRKSAQGPVFSDTKIASQMPNPLATSTAAAAGQPVALKGSPEQVPGAVPSGAPSEPPSVPQPGVAMAATNPPSTPVQEPGAANPPPAAQVSPGLINPVAPIAASTATVASATPGAVRPEEPSLRYNPKVHRDPMMSPMDVKRLAQMELEREDERRRLEDEERKRHEKPKLVKRIAPAIETTVLHYGITPTPGSITAIVEANGGDTQIVKAGDVLSNKVRVVRITQSTVTFQFKTKRWSRSLSK